MVHNRTDKTHELYSYNLYPGPSAKKGLYGVLLNQGEKENWVIAHCSAVQSISPYDNITTFMHKEPVAEEKVNCTSILSGSLKVEYY